MILRIFFEYINKWHKDIKFTFERAKDTIPYLDLNLSITNNKIDFSIYRKPTHTDNIIPNNSNTSFNHKISAIYAFINRLINIPMSNDNYIKELNIIKQVAYKNGYQIDLIDKLVKKKLYKKNLKANTGLIPIEKNRNTSYISIPYIKKISDQIAKVFNNYNICTTFTYTNKLKDLFCKNKDPIDKLDKPGIYKLNCQGDCRSTYIGMTTRSIRTRINEHWRCIKNNNKSFNNQSTFAEHILKTGHSFDPGEDVEVLHNLNKHMQIFENYEINKFKSNQGVHVLNEFVPAAPVITRQLGL